MDKAQAQQVFKDQILSRWPDFQLSKAMLDDWVWFLSNFTPDQVEKAIKQYVLNFDSFKKPALNKFREIINAQNPKTDTFNNPKEEKWPQYFLQQDAKDCPYWGYGTFSQLIINLDDPNLQLKIAQQTKLSYINLYGGHWNVIICNDAQERGLLIEDRSKKNRLGKLGHSVQGSTTTTMPLIVTDHLI